MKALEYERIIDNPEQEYLYISKLILIEFLEEESFQKDLDNWNTVFDLSLGDKKEKKIRKKVRSEFKAFLKLASKIAPMVYKRHFSMQIVSPMSKSSTGILATYHDLGLWPYDLPDPFPKKSQCKDINIGESFFAHYSNIKKKIFLRKSILSLSLKVLHQIIMKIRSVKIP